MSHLRGLFAALAMLVVAAFAHAGQAGVCVTPPLADTVGLNDGCSVPGLATWVFPDTGVFKTAFTPACNNHDRCFSALGATASACNDKFLGDLRSACDSNYTFLSGPVYQLCMDTAAQYHSAVVAYTIGTNPMSTIQPKAEARSQNVLGPWIANDYCATTPELSGAYDSSLITQINGAFQTYAHRSPSIYEFMATVNDGDLIADRAGWNNRVIQHAIAAASVTLPSVGLTWNSAFQVYNVSPVTPGATYSWGGLEGLRAGGTSAVAWAHDNPYNTVVTIGAVLRANAGGVRNQVIIPEHQLTVRGTCGPKAGNPCV